VVIIKNALINVIRHQHAKNIRSLWKSSTKYNLFAFAKLRCGAVVGFVKDRNFLRLV